MGLGILAVSFYLLYVVYFASKGQAYNALWVCHLGCLLIGIGLLAKNKMINSAGLIWISAGIPLWILNFLSGAEPPVVSFLTHCGGFFLGLSGVFILGIKRRVWVFATTGMILYSACTRFFTPPSQNINLAYSIWPGWEKYFLSFPLFISAVLFYCFSIALLAEKFFLFLHFQKFDFLRKKMFFNR